MLTEKVKPKANQTACTSGLQILRFPAVLNKTGLSKSAIKERIRTSGFPAPIPLGPRAVGFIAHEVENWLQALVIDGRTRVPGTRANLH